MNKTVYPAPSKLKDNHYYARSNRQSNRRLDDVETENPSLVECIFEGDCLDIAEDDAA